MPHRRLLISMFVALLASMAWVLLQRGRALIIYNHSPSLPVGFYLRSGAEVRLGAIVTVRAVDVAPEEAHRRHFDTASDFFIKRVAASSGDTVCASGDKVSINGRLAALRRARDSAGHALARWNGCRVLKRDQIFLLGDSADSFDARYWGPISRSLLEGVWRPLSWPLRKQAIGQSNVSNGAPDTGA